MNERFQNATQLKAQQTPPIWMMRQAGRYHSHYQNMRKKHSFMELCKNPELAAEVARGPVADFDFDVSILFSDLLFPLEALGMGLQYTDAKGPELGWHLNESNIKNFKSVEEALPQLEFQKEAMKLTREVLPKNKSLIGFVGGPWTLFGYAVEGSHKGAMSVSKGKISLFQSFCKTMVPLLIKNIQLQFEGGAEVVMVLDTAAGELSPQIYHSLVVPELEKMSQAFPKKLGLYSKGITADHHIGLNQWSGFGFDHRFEMSKLLLKKDRGFIQGNFDQSLLFLEPSDFRKVVQDFISPIRDLNPEQRAGWVAGLGHGILPKTPEKNVRTFVELVREAF